MSCRHPETSIVCSSCLYIDECAGWLEDDEAGKTHGKAPKTTATGLERTKTHQKRKPARTAKTDVKSKAAKLR